MRPTAPGGFPAYGYPLGGPPLQGFTGSGMGDHQRVQPLLSQEGIGPMPISLYNKLELVLNFPAF